MSDENVNNAEKVERRGRPKGVRDKVPRKKRTDFTEIADPGENSKITAFHMQMMNMDKVDTSDRSAVEERIYWYFDQCIRNDIRPGVAGLCLALGITRIAWYQWGSENWRGYSDIVAKTRAVMESILEQYMLKNKLNVAAGIFMLKNHFGYRDQTDHLFAVEQKDPLGPTTSTEELRRRYLERKAPDYVDDTADDDEDPQSE